MEETRQFVSRADAVRLGLKRFYIGVCQNGHDCERHVSSRQCVQCTKIKLDRWKVENREKYLSYHAKRAPRPERIERAREKRRTNRDEFNAGRREYYKANRKRVLEATKRSQIKHIEKHRVRVNTKKRNRNAAKARIGGAHTPADISALFRAQRGRCGYCRVSISKGYHVDHIQPISKGGSNWPSNLQLLCQRCNLRKSAKDPIVFAQELGRLI